MIHDRRLSASRWIAAAQQPELVDHRRATTVFSTDVELSAPVQQARLRVTALGVVESFLNGSRIGHDEFVPGFTEYDQRLQVFEYDVTAMLATGSNELWFELSDGWYCGSVGMFRSRDQWGSVPAIRVELELNNADGERVIGSDGSWASRPSSHFADMMHGETFDFRADRPGSRDAVADSGWQGASEIDGPEGFIGVEAEPVRITETVAPVDIREHPAGWIVDFGENIVGGVSLDALGPAGNRLRFVYGEALDASGDVSQRNFTPEMPFIPFPLLPGQVDEVISAGDGTMFLPRHSSKGFRFVRIEGELDLASVQRIRALVMHTDFATVGGFHSSSDDLNWLEAATRRGLLGNALDIPTDCPTRERAGWTADWDIFFPTAAAMVDVNRFTRKWLRDVAVKQWQNGVGGNMAPMPQVEGEHGKMAGMNGSAGWADSIVSIPWAHYGRYADASILAEFWPNMERWLTYVTNAAETQRHESRVAAHPVALPHERYLWDTGFHFGEWFEPDTAEVDLAALAAADSGPIATAFYRRTTQQMANIARVLGDEIRAAELDELSEHIRQAWRTEFLDADGRLIPATQANCVRALAFDLVDPTERESVASQLVELIHAAGGHLGTGFLATPYLLPTLVDAGYPEVAFEVLMQRDYPSWLLMKDQGATTIWERWGGYDADGTPSESHNHYSKGAVTSFLYEYVAGLRRVHGRLDEIVFQPLPGYGVESAEAWVQLPAGPTSIVWELDGDQLVVDTVVPDGVIATFIAPDGTRTVVPHGRNSLVIGLQHPKHLAGS